jgi:hypothetical protein
MQAIVALMSVTVVAFTGPTMAACGLVGSMTFLNEAIGGDVW